MLDMCRAQFWVDSFTTFFGFCHSVCNSVVTLFFEALLCSAWLFLRGKFLTFVSFVVRWFVSVSLARFPQFFPAIFCFFLCSGLFIYVILIAAIVSVVLLKNFLIFFARFRVCIFSVKTIVLHRFALDRFGLFVCFFTFACNHASGMLISQPCASIDCPDLPILYSLTNLSQAQS